MRSFLERTGDFFGAFADTVILIPIMILLSRNPGYRLDILLVTSGIAYFASGLLFRIPMPVQPLKSIAIASLAMGASSLEIQLSGFIVGICFLALYFFKVKSLPIPDDVVRSIQFSLGALLLKQAFFAAPLSAPQFVLGVFIIAGALLADRKLKLPLLGLMTFAIFSFALFRFTPSESSSAPAITPQNLRLPLILALVLPQLALTSANSIAGTLLASEHYFKDSSKSVNIKKLLLSIGLGNILMGMIHGLPFCHGSGGMTAHYKAGARSPRMNFIMGIALVLLGLVAFRYPASITFPTAMVAVTLAIIGIFHFALAQKTASTPKGKILLALATLITLLSSNLFYALISAWTGLILINRFQKETSRVAV